MRYAPQFGKRRRNLSPSRTGGHPSVSRSSYFLIALGVIFVAMLAGFAAGSLQLFNRSEVNRVLGSELASGSTADEILIAEGKELARFALKDPESALFRNVRIAGARRNVCGLINGRAPAGGYAGYARFIVTEGKVYIERDLLPGDEDDGFQIHWVRYCQ